MEIPKENLDKLKCTQCNKYLSCFPIKLTDENRSFCGRCSTTAALTDENSLHVTTYELLAKYMRFPCSFDGCLATLLPSEVVQHELSCLYKKIDCFLQHDCNFDGNRDEFYQHCNDAHQTLILKNCEFEIDLIATYEQNNLVKYENEFFIIKRRYDKPTNLLTCALVGIDDNVPYKYQIIIKNGKRDKSIEFGIKTIENYAKTPNNFTEIVIDEVVQQLNHPSVLIGSIKMIENHNENGNGAQLQHDLLKELECPVCFEYMFPPIKLCETGHSICSNCLANIRQCPLCRSSFKINQRNITLESMANRLNFPCKYNERGCFFISNLTRIREHLEFCKFAPKKCLLHDYVDCRWTGLEKDLFTHITAQHHDNTMDYNQIHTYINDNFFNEEFRCCYILNFFGRLFKLHHLYRGNRFYWAMQFNESIMLGDNRNQCFKYELDFIDNNGNDQKMTFRDLCTSMKNKTDCFRDGDRFVIVESSQIKRFIADNTLSYRIHLIKY